MLARSFLVAALASLALLLPGAAQAKVQAGVGYTYYETGDLAAPTPKTPELGLLLIGGSDWSEPAWRWFAGKAGEGHLGILRASRDGSDGEWLMEHIGGLASVQTLVFSDREAAFEPRVAEILQQADGIFIAGGDQSKYVRFWKDTPVSDALNAHVAAGRC